LRPLSPSVSGFWAKPKICNFGHFLDRKSFFFFCPDLWVIFATMSTAPFSAVHDGDLVNFRVKKQKKIKIIPTLGSDLGGVSHTAQIAS
jgi:hypothetical protein